MADVGFKELIELLHTIITPVNASLNEHGKSITNAAQQISRLADLFNSEPTRQTIINALREEMKSHDENFEETLARHETTCGSRHQAFFEKDGQARIEAIRLAEERLASKVKIIDELKERFNWLLLAIGISYVTGLAAIGYLSWTLTQLKRLT